MDHFEPLRHKECGKHEKRTNDNDILRSCETCERQFYVCDLCRTAKAINVPYTICIKCAPAMKTMNSVLLKKDTAIIDYHKKLIKLEAEIRSVDHLKKRMDHLNKNNEDYQNKLQSTENELDHFKKELEKAKTEIDRQNEELKRKRELAKNLFSLQKSLDYTDVTIVCGAQKYSTHKCVLACRSEYLRDLLCKPPEKHIHTLQCKNHNEATKKGKNNANDETDSIADSSSNPSPKGTAKGKPVAAGAPQPPAEKAATKPAEKEKKTASPSNIEICDSHLESMSFLMNYIYTSEIDKLNDKNVLHLIRTADKLAFPDLKIACITYMFRHVSKTTAVPFLIKAYEYKDNWLKSKCSRFIFEESIDLAKHSDYMNFKKDDPKLALELYEGHIKEIDDMNSNFKSNESLESEISGGSVTTRLILPKSNKSSPTESKNNNGNGISLINTARSQNSPTSLPMIKTKQ